MTATTAQEIATEYARAWLAGDVDTALSFVADDVVCAAPGGVIKGVEAYRQFLTPFASALAGSELIHAAAVYTVETPFAKDFRGMDYFTVSGGKISQVISVFDRLPAVQASGGLKN